jgi:hypothetical protein
MAGTTCEDRLLSRLTKICLALPEAERRYNGSHAAFLVRKRTFAYFLNDHHLMVSFRSRARLYLVITSSLTHVRKEWMMMFPAAGVQNK